MEEIGKVDRGPLFPPKKGLKVLMVLRLVLSVESTGESLAGLAVGVGGGLGGR